ncbi:MAG: response regulator [Legionella sp.]|nr:response regulator [Legionella sp.]
MAMDPKLYHLLFETFKGELIEQHQIMVDALIKLEKTKDKKNSQELLNLLFRTSHNLKGAAKSVEIDKIAALAHQLEDQFSVWREKNKVPDKKQINQCLKLVDQMLEQLKQAEKNTSASSLSLDEMVRVPLRRIERINSKLNELIIFQLRLTKWTKNIEHALNMLKHQDIKQIEKQLTALLDDAGILTGEFSRDLFILQQEGKSMRLLPMSHVFSPLERMVREVSADLDKSVALNIEGGDVEIDKSILDALKTPLQHLIRNAIAHGIEDKATRKKQGKPACANISIQAANEAGQIQIILSDDGQGIDVEKLKEQALNKNLYTQEALNKLSESDVLRLIFHSGVSTAKTVSELSGRGVGLDAVLNDIEAVKGKIKVKSIPGGGCTFTLILPLALASSRGLFVKLNDLNFMLPTVSLDALYSIKSTQLTRIDNQWAVVVKDKPITVSSLSDILGVGEIVLDNTKDYDGVLVSGKHAQMMLLVDEIIEEHDCVLKPLPKPLNQLKHLSGATLTETGELVLALNMDNVLEKAVSDKRIVLKVKTPDMSESELEAKETVERVLVVDDALTTRTLAINALHAAGYATLDAEDGQKALELLQTNKVDCVVTDIEMPLMGGFELTRRIKKDENLLHMPVVIVSSHDTEADKKHGLAVGASAYLVKKDFDTRILINMIESLL